ncbi:putative polyketide biosynthesis zinc-dependent hydrolase BaeB [Paenibacillus plantiphilus]|uniref:Polyketide biosynthesis zinc-dependent hydrolase BaeB n=1 Tax=Paenibacillus plantiphilus TaxID=2905650 RepID=A0ABM9C200_9BACL|nr:MBL fold metallo-hydrolase [Paenibacillus plantiphilus]CAH1200612.1 putative polyketide biosynthesis zinc-dependent hydrolase BaeB [Paenibacillus plantiphilus]
MQAAVNNAQFQVYSLRTSSLRFINYCYLIVEKASNYAILVDPAWEWETITGKLEELQVQLKAILLTHSHQDHVHLVQPLLDVYDPQVYMSRCEMDDYRYDCRNLNALQDSDILSVGGLKIAALLTPGHTSGSMCYHMQGVLFTGDTLFTEGCGNCNTKGGSAEQMFESIQRLRLLPTHTRIFPGHSFGHPPGQTLGYLLKENIYMLIHNKEQFVHFRNRKNQSTNARFR